MLVTELVEKANKSIGNLLDAIENIPAQEMTTPNTISKWSIKDILNHIAIWEEEAAKSFEIWKVGIEPDWSYVNNLDEFNNRTVKQRRKLSLAKIINQLNLVHNGVLENITSVSDTEYYNRGGIPKWLVILVSSHIDEHTKRIIEYKNTVEDEERKIA